MKKDILTAISKEKNGVLRTSDAITAGVSRPYFLQYVRENGYEQIERGIYLAPDSWDDGMYLLQLQYGAAIFSHETALYLLNLTDREPIPYTVTVRQGYNPSKIQQKGVRVHTVLDKWYSIGMEEFDTPMGNKVQAYNAERTLCDIVRSSGKVERSVQIVAVREYVSRPTKDIPKLLEYGRVFRVSKRLREYLEVLLG